MKGYHSKNAQFEGQWNTKEIHENTQGIVPSLLEFAAFRKYFLYSTLVIGCILFYGSIHIPTSALTNSEFIAIGTIKDAIQNRRTEGNLKKIPWLSVGNCGYYEARGNFEKIRNSIHLLVGVKF